MATRVYICLKKIGEKIIENKDFLTELDREIGDADHGANMAKGFAAVIEQVPQDTPDIGAVLKKTGMTLISTVGGASGPLYGTAYMEAAKVLSSKEELTAEDMKNVLEAAVVGIKKRGKSEKGEKITRRIYKWIITQMIKMSKGGGSGCPVDIRFAQTGVKRRRKPCVR